MNKQRVILVAEDELFLRTLIAEKFEELGHIVYQAKDGLEGFEMAEKIKPDLVISDIYMPKKNGGRFLSDLRNSDFGKNMPFIAITARTELGDHFKSIANAIFVGKPFKLKELVEHVERMLSEIEAKEAVQATQEQKGQNSTDPSLTGLDIGGQQETLIKDSMLGVEDKAPKDSAPQEEKKSKDPSESGSRVKKSANKKILIYEAQATIYQALEKILLSNGCATEAVASERECLQEARRIFPDIILIRSKAGERKAEGFAAQLREDPVLKNTPIIVYEDIGTLKKKDQADAGGSFVWSPEGKQLVEMILQLLH